MESVPILSASWLSPPSSSQSHGHSLVPTHIKQLRTTAPKDMKAAKEKRSRERTLAKERRKATVEKSKKIPKRVIITA